ncbi:uncharacterized protein LOC131931269 isoform X2 [Physella acuta]|uniref:uncharacterized protein LOC131931269 isoform X2 n=1 Tax=Physella acuta TaxID=109671 RepID=UPI0027DBF0D5|nr:uncharacterized protein LOC131931269 isoform X2 [Physella acuta]
MAFKFILGHHIKSILNDVEEKQKEDIRDLTKGHLNESRLYKAPITLSSKFWSSAHTNHVKTAVRQSKVREKAKDKAQQKLDALFNFSLGTTGLTTEKKNSDKSFSVSTKAKTSELSCSQLDGILIEELCPPPSTVLDAHTPTCTQTRGNILPRKGVTCAEHYMNLKTFDTYVLEKSEMLEQNILSGEKAVRHLQTQLKMGLEGIDETSIGLDRLQVFSNIFVNIIEESQTFCYLLSSIKAEYDSYLAILLKSQLSHLDLLKHQVVNFTSRGLSRPREMTLAIQKLDRLEENARVLLDLNRKLKDELRRDIQTLSKTPEIPAKRTPIGSQPKLEQAIDLSQELENVKALILEKLDEFNAVHVRLREDYVPTTVCTHLEECIKETEVEVQKLLKQNEYFERSIAEMESDLREAILEADTSEKDGRRIWHKVT